MALYATHGEEDKMLKIGFGLVLIFRLVKNSYFFFEQKKISYFRRKRQAALEMQ